MRHLIFFCGFFLFLLFFFLRLSMVNKELAEQVFGYFGLILWSFQMAPQVYKNYRLRSTEGVSPYMLLLWVLSGVALGNYNIGLGVAIPLIVQPQLFVLITLLCLVQELYFDRGWRKATSLATFVGVLMVAGAVEVGLTYAYREAAARGDERAIQFFGVLPVMLILLGFVPQYWDILYHRRVQGISHVFLFMDFFGSVFSTISLAFRPSIDALSLVNYIGIAVFDAGIWLLYYAFLWIPGLQKKNKRDDVKDVEHNSTSSVATVDKDVAEANKPAKDTP
ncbi:PQ loop repeat-domain-containing protein [Gongronella butleri]|nr:PQ loop repeat-domain-containing protein [Gongronella butleri]